MPSSQVLSFSLVILESMISKVIRGMIGGTYLMSDVTCGDIFGAPGVSDEGGWK